ITHSETYLFMEQPVRALNETLRAEMRRFLNEIPPDQIERESLIVNQKVIESERYRTSKRISVYISKQRAEISTKSIIYDIFSKEKLCYVPRWTGASMEMVKLNSLQDYLSLEDSVDELGFPTLDNQEREIATQLDLIIIPGMAYDLDGNRLSYNREDPYNEYLAKCERWKSPPKIMALALDGQILRDGNVPVTDENRKPHIILSPSQDIW
ncbi:11075_t:CDS:2, partial [Dentiscutata erythropus]